MAGGGERQLRVGIDGRHRWKAVANHFIPKVKAVCDTFIAVSLSLGTVHLSLCCERIACVLNTVMRYHTNVPPKATIRGRGS